ncbi:RNA polymerase factor sigma-54 [Stagnimonas aquatica]|uniref:RNA polymerase sigma-54 factor n=1 Tax=Stagnimonas aquatica TaxID=2689987 RepID=A0A3N0VL06_9GAMM|nr:RNA polymerase factor sigma-54 [Stagnimonas aquatica]ROH93447.1 RNA polymerase factor sigma-54 [Stagnimonas aquatica]
MRQALGLRTGQALTMTPALQQAIRMLQLSTLDLKQEIQQAIESNVMLELDEDAAGESPDDLAPEMQSQDGGGEDHDSGEVSDLRVSEDNIPEEMPVDADWSDIYDTAPSRESGGEDEEDLAEFRRANLRESETLQEHLRWQARLAPFSEWEAEVADYLIDAVNEDGYLENWDEACVHFRETMGLDPRRIEKVLRVVQDFDPPGVAARDLGECLTLQLHLLPANTPGRAAALALVAKHLMLIARRDLGALRRASGYDEAELKVALALIRSLQPHPGRPYAAHESDYIEPDVFVTKHQGRWKVSLNREASPSVRINPHYLAMVKRADSSRDQVTLKTHLQEARYFLHSLQSRNDTLLRVAQCIVEEQRAFLEYGHEAMRPLVLRDVASQLGIHESTVSRATANKYLLTPRGLFELKHFFSSHVQTVGGGVASATAIQAMLKRLISGEQPNQPLSDATLAELLQKEGIQVARRTVAKYREALGIPPSHERRPL